MIYLILKLPISKALPYLQKIIFSFLFKFDGVERIELSLAESKSAVLTVIRYAIIFVLHTYFYNIFHCKNLSYYFLSILVLLVRNKLLNYLIPLSNHISKNLYQNLKQFLCFHLFYSYLHVVFLFLLKNRLIHLINILDHMY